MKTLAKNLVAGKFLGGGEADINNHGLGDFPPDFKMHQIRQFRC